MPTTLTTPSDDPVVEAERRQLVAEMNRLHRLGEQTADRIEALLERIEEFNHQRA